MSLGKKDIAKNISSKAQISYRNSYQVLKSFLTIVKSNKDRSIKIPNFGVFYVHSSPKRVGRNPKTREEFRISPKKKLTFRTSSTVKNIFN